MILHFYELGKFPPNISSNLQGSYTWFSKGWREAFESGNQEPWVFRGGLSADLRRLLAVECAPDGPRAPHGPPHGPPAGPRPYTPRDYRTVCTICHKTCRDGSDCSDLFPSDLQTLPADRLVAPFLILNPELCMVIEEEDGLQNEDSPQNEDSLQNEDSPQNEDSAGDKADDESTVDRRKPEIVGYACATLNSKEFYKKQEIAWIPEMCEKYPESLIERDDLSQAAKESVRHFHAFAQQERAPEAVCRAHPALLTCCVAPPAAAAAPRLLAALLAALRAHGVNGVHTCINATDHYLHQFYSKLGFVEVHREETRVYLARAF